MGNKTMTARETGSASVPALDAERVAMVRLAAAIAAGAEETMRRAVAGAVAHLRPQWAEEVILQSYLFAGFPRTLNAMREWRRASGAAAPPRDDGESLDGALGWATRGEVTCARVYGESYAPLRRNIRGLHPALDAWMIVEGYGKVLSRPELELRLRELCIVAACAAAGQDRQLHSHLHGALNAGATLDEVRATLDQVEDFTTSEQQARYHALLVRVSRHHVR
jgi:4-carboxymuconolactone decarboxylase